MAMVAGAHFQANLVHTRHPAMGLGLGQIASLVDDDLHPRRSVPPRAVTQETATRVRAKPVSMEELDQSLMNVSNGNSQYSARSAFFPEEPAPQTCARPVRRALAGVTNTLCNTQNPSSTFPPLTSAKASSHSLHSSKSLSDQTAATRMYSEEPRQGGGSRAVHGLSFPAARNMLWDHSPTAPVIHLSSNELAPTVHVEAAVGERLSKHFSLMSRADRSPTNGEVPSLHLRTLWACGEGVTLNLQEVKATDELQQGDRGYTPLRMLLADGAPHRTPVEAVAFAQRATSNASDMDALVQSFKQGCCQNGDLSLPHLLNISCVACPTAVEGEGVVLGCMAVPNMTVRVVRLHSLRICDTALSRSLKAAQHAQVPTPLSGYLTLDQARKLLPLLPTEPRAYDLPLVGVWVSGVSSPRHPLVWAALQRFLFNSNLKDKVLSQGALMLQLYVHGHANPVCYDCIPSSMPTPSNQGSAFICYQFMAKIGGGGRSGTPLLCHFAAVHNSMDTPLPESQPLRDPPTPAHSPTHSASMAAAPFPGQPPTPHAAPYHAFDASHHAYGGGQHFNAASPTSPAGGSYGMHWPGSFQPPQPFQASAPTSPWQGSFSAGGSPQHAGTNSDNLIMEQQKQLLALQEQVLLLQNQLMSSTAKGDCSPQPASYQHPPPSPQGVHAGSHSNSPFSFPGTFSKSYQNSSPSSQVAHAGPSPTSTSAPLLNPSSWMQNLPATYRPPPPTSSLPNAESRYAHSPTYEQQRHQQQPEHHQQATLKITHTHTSHTSTHTHLMATTATLGRVVLPATGLPATSQTRSSTNEMCEGPTEDLSAVRSQDSHGFLTGPQVRDDQRLESYGCSSPNAELQGPDTHKPQAGARSPNSDTVNVRAGNVVMQRSGRAEELALDAAKAASKVTEVGVRRGLNLQNSMLEINPQSTLEDALEEAVLLHMPDAPTSPVGLEPEDLSPRRSLPSETQPLPTGPMMEYPHPSFREILPTAGGKSSAQPMAQSSKTGKQTEPRIPAVPSVPETHSDLPHVIFHALSDEDCDSSDDEVELICQRYLNNARYA